MMSRFDLKNLGSRISNEPLCPLASNTFQKIVIYSDVGFMGISIPVFTSLVYTVLLYRRVVNKSLTISIIERFISRGKKFARASVYSIRTVSNISSSYEDEENVGEDSGFSDDDGQQEEENTGIGYVDNIENFAQYNKKNKKKTKRTRKRIKTSSLVTQIRKSKDKIRKSNQPAAKVKRQSENTKDFRLDKKKELKLTKKVFILCVIMLFSLIPTLAILIMIIIYEDELNKDHENFDVSIRNTVTNLYTISLLIIYVNSITNCLIYSINSPGFKNVSEAAVVYMYRKILSLVPRCLQPKLRTDSVFTNERRRHSSVATTSTLVYFKKPRLARVLREIEKNNSKKRVEKTERSDQSDLQKTTSSNAFDQPIRASKALPVAVSNTGRASRFTSPDINRQHNQDIITSAKPPTGRGRPTSYRPTKPIRKSQSMTTSRIEPIDLKKVLLERNFRHTSAEPISTTNRRNTTAVNQNQATSSNPSKSSSRTSIFQGKVDLGRISKMVTAPLHLQGEDRKVNKPRTTRYNIDTSGSGSHVVRNRDHQHMQQGRQTRSRAYEDSSTFGSPNPFKKPNDWRDQAIRNQRNGSPGKSDSFTPANPFNYKDNMNPEMQPRRTVMNAPRQSIFGGFNH